MMRCHTLLAILILGIALIGNIVMAQTADSVDQKPPVTLGTLPDIKLQPRPPLTDAQAKHIKGLIASLATLDKPDFGLSPTMTGSNFAPIPNQEYADALLLTKHDLATASPLKELVTLGSDALPFLLDALDDQTPTKLVLSHDGHFGSMLFSNELWLNPVNQFEEAVYKEHVKRVEVEPALPSYTVKIGDVCFVAVGQIVGRPYLAVRYQPTANIILNSTTNDAKLCAHVREIWKSTDPRQRLFDSLCADYSTVGVFNGNSLDGWDEGNEFQCGAALRLLYYFPQETTGLLAHRLEILDVGADANVDDYIRRCVVNQVRSEQFIKAVAWSSDPSIRKALTEITERSARQQPAAGTHSPGR